MPGSVLCQGAGGAEPRRVWLCPVARSVDEGTGCAHTHLVVGSWGPRGWQPPGCARAPPRLHASWGHSAGAGLGSIMRAPVGCGLQADLSLSPFLSSGHKTHALRPFWCWSLVSLRTHLRAGSQSWFQSEALDPPPLVPPPCQGCPRGCYTWRKAAEPHNGPRRWEGGCRSGCEPGTSRHRSQTPSIFQQVPSVLPGGAVPKPRGEEKQRCFSKHPVYFGRAREQTAAPWQRCCLALGVSPVAGEGEGGAERQTPARSARMALHTSQGHSLGARGAVGPRW